MNVDELEKMVLDKIEYHVWERHHQGNTSSPAFEACDRFELIYEGPWEGEGPDGEDEIDENCVCYHVYFTVDFKSPDFENEFQSDGVDSDLLYGWVRLDKGRPWVDLVDRTNFEKGAWENMMKNMYAYFLKYDSFDMVKSL